MYLKLLINGYIYDLRTKQGLTQKELASKVGLNSLIDYNIDNKISMAEYFKKASLDSLKEKL